MADDNSPATEARENLISSFTQFTSSSREEAQSFLQAHHWNLDDAVSAFIENNVSAASASASAVESNVFNPSDQQNPGILNARARSSWNLGIDYDPSTSRIRSRSPSPPSRARYPNLSTGQPAGDIGDTSGGTAKDSDEPMENYVSGDQSGTMVQGSQEGVNDSDVERPLVFTYIVTLWRNGYTINDEPFKTFDNPKDEPFIEFIQRVESQRELKTRFNLIRRQDEDFHVTPFQGVGSDSVSAEPPASSPTSRAMSTAQPAGEFTDSDSNEPQENYGGGDQSGTMVQDHQEGEDDDVSDVVFTQVVTLWRNGFSMNDGPLETLDKQKNVDFIEAIKRAESPREFKAHLRLIRHQNEDFHEPFTPFQGLGRTLGRSASVSVEPSVSLVVDPPAPTTSIRLRLADGTRIVSRFNTHHTVRDIRSFIDESRPDGSRDYQLLSMGVPPRPLTDLDQTIEDADISNSVLIQKY